MGDPLSIAASVTGLLAVAGKIAITITGFISSVADAPESAQATLTAVEEARIVLTSIRHVMDGLRQFPRYRKEMIHMEHIVLVFREAIQSFSELEATVSPASSTWDRVKWVLEEDKILRHVQRLESHKSSLSMMLSILQCESDAEAHRCLTALQDQVQELKEQNQAILRRFEECNLQRGVDGASVRFFDDDQSTIGAQSTFRANTESDPQWPLTPILEDSKTSETVAGIAISPQDYEITLEQTYVYRRVRSNDSDISFTSSVNRTNAWSMLSELSLNDISVISVIAMPITLEEINSIGSQLTFANLLYDAQNQSNKSGMSYRPSKPDKDVSDTAQLSSWNFSVLHRRRGSEAKGATTAMQSPEVWPLDGQNIGPSGYQRTLKPRDLEPPAFRKLALRKLVVQGRIRKPPTQSPVIYNPPEPIVQRRISPARGYYGYLPHHKVVVLGDSSRTELCFKMFLPNLTSYEPAAFEDNFTKHLVIDKQPCMLEALNVAGEEVYTTSLRDQWVRDGNCFFLVYSINKRSSFDEVLTLHMTILRVKDDGYDWPIMLVGTNSDLSNEREVSEEEGTALAKQLGLCRFIEVSAKLLLNVEKCFYDLVRMIREQEDASKELARSTSSKSGRSGRPISPFF